MADRGDADNAIRELLEFTEGRVGRLQLRAHQTLTSASPVDVGFFRSRWTVSTGIRPGETGERPSTTGTRASRKAEARRRRKANTTEAQKLAKAYRLRLGRVFISNPTIYGPRLAAGWSSQAKSGWIERAISKAIRSEQRTARGG